MTPTRFPSPAERARRARLIELLDEGKVLIQVAPQHPEVDLPAHLRDELAVGLALSRRFGLSVLELGPLALRASLSFGGERYLCVVPWMAIFSMKSYASDGHAFYPESVPPELLAGLQLAQVEAPEGAEEPTAKAELAPAPPPVETPDDDPPEPPTGRPRLRIVKP